MPKSFLFLALALILNAGCPPADEEIEGDEAGECSDGADNDQDGAADCADTGCAADLACAGDDDDDATGDDDDDATGDDDDATGDDDDATGDDDDATGDDDDDATGDDDDDDATGDDDDATPDPLDVDDDGDGITENDGDCDDTDAANFPGNIEVCDGQDNDCNPNTGYAG